jgi:hypothetical protein
MRSQLWSVRWKLRCIAPVSGELLFRVPEDFRPATRSAKRNLVVLFSHFNALVCCSPRVERLVDRQTLMHVVNLFKSLRMK